MLYDEEKVLNICKKYGIEVETTEGYPTYMGKEMDENFSISQVMYEKVESTNNNPIIHISELVQFNLPIIVDDSNMCCVAQLSVGENTLVYKKESDEEENMSSIPCDNKNKYAA